MNLEPETRPPEIDSPSGSQGGAGGGPHGIATLDASGQIQSCTAKLGDLHGYDPDTLCGMHWSTLCADKEVGRLRVVEFARARLQSSARGYVELRRRDGGVFTGEISIFALEGGKWLWLCGRTSTGVMPPLDPCEMRKALSHASHSLRSPLATVSTSVQMLLALGGTLEPGKNRRHLNNALGHLAEVNELVGDCVFVAEMLTGGPAPAEPVCLNALLGDLAKQRGAREPGVSGHPPAIVCTEDARRMAATRPGATGTLIRNLLDICAPFRTTDDPGTLSVDMLGSHARISIVFPDMTLPPLVRRLLESPLLLHSEGHDDSALWFRYFVVGLCLRLLFGHLEVKEAGGGIAIEATVIP